MNTDVPLNPCHRQKSSHKLRLHEFVTNPYPICIGQIHRKAHAELWILVPAQSLLSWLSHLVGSFGYRQIFLCALFLPSSFAYSAGEHQYLTEGNLLVGRLTEILIREGICENTTKCSSSDGGHAFVKPVKGGVEVSIYGVDKAEISSKLLQEAAGSFATRDIGRHLLLQIFLPSKNAVSNNKLLRNERPIYSLRVEK